MHSVFAKNKTFLEEQKQFPNKENFENFHALVHFLYKTVWQKRSSIPLFEQSTEVN